MNAFIQSDKSLTIAFEYGNHYTVENTHEYYIEILSAVKKQNWSQACHLINKSLLPLFADLEAPYAPPPQRLLMCNKVDGSTIAAYDSVDEAHMRTGISKDDITNTCLGERVTDGGYLWKWEGDRSLTREHNDILDCDDAFLAEQFDDFEDCDFPGMN